MRRVVKRYANRKLYDTTSSRYVALDDVAAFVRRGDEVEVTLLFLESSDDVLVRRFSETRRPHPLATDQPVIEGIRRERELLAPLRERADMVFDSSQWSVHEIRNQVYREFASHPGEEPGMVLSLVSFGFKHGIPQGTDLLFDVRYLSNPHFVPGLREQTGRDPEVLEYLRQRGKPEFHPELMKIKQGDVTDDGPRDELFDEAVKIIIESGIPRL